MNIKYTVWGVACGLALLLPVHSYGEVTYRSVLNIAGSANIGGMFLNWSCNAPGDTVCFSSPSITYRDLTGSSSMANVSQYNGTFGLIPNIGEPSQPLDVPFLVPITIPSAGTKTPSDTCAGLPNCSASVPGSPNLSAPNLDANSTGTAVTLGLTGTVQDSLGVSGPISDAVATEIAAQNPQQALASVLAAGSSGLSVDDSAQISLSPIPVDGALPEPATLALCGAGLLALGILRMRQRKE